MKTEGNEDSVQATEQRPLHSLPRAAIEGAAQNVNAVFSISFENAEVQTQAAKID